MIKSLFEDDENQSNEIKSEENENAVTESISETSPEPRYVEVNEAENLPDAPDAAFDEFDDLEMSLSDDELEKINSFIERTSETKNFPEPRFDQPEQSLTEMGNKAVISEPPIETVVETTNSVAETANYETPAAARTEETQLKNNDELLFQSPAKPESFAETARKSGLAYAAAITLFGAVVFMLIIGWFADLLFGTSPWGVVGGIILGSIMGFIQFFRMTSQILKNKD